MFEWRNLLLADRWEDGEQAHGQQARPRRGKIAVCWTAAITCLCAIWWIFEPIPIPATSIIPFALFPLVASC